MLNRLGPTPWHAIASPGFSEDIESSARQRCTENRRQYLC